MARDDLQEPLESFASRLDHLVREPALARQSFARLLQRESVPSAEDLPRKLRDVDARALSLEDVAEGLKIGVAATDGRVADAESGDVGLRKVLSASVCLGRDGDALGT